MQVLEVEAVARAAHRVGRRAGFGRLLDLDHLRAPVGELAHGGRAGAMGGEVEDLDVGERKLGHGVYRPLNIGLRFSMNARRPSLKSSLSKQASAIFSSFA